ncbi:MAG: DnaB-like helicase N-terminal domain-containing protein, partial [Chitinophagales bacterium]
MTINEGNTSDVNRTGKRISKQTDATSFALGKVPPQAVDLEEAVLGAFMIDRDAVTNAIELLRIDSFYDDRHKLIFEAIRKLFEKTQPIDLLTVTEMLR